MKNNTKSKNSRKSYNNPKSCPKGQVWCGRATNCIVGSTQKDCDQWIWSPAPISCPPGYIQKGRNCIPENTIQENTLNRTLKGGRTRRSRTRRSRTRRHR